MNARKRTIIGVLAILTILAATGGSFAYYTTQATAKNTVVAGNIAIEMQLSEPGTDEQETQSGDAAILPGQTLKRTGRGKNVGDQPCYVRARLGETDGATFLYDGTDTAHWTYREGYWYYDAALAPGEETTPLFTSISLNAEADNAFAGAGLTLDAELQATQVKNNGDDALTAKGWPDGE